MSAPDDTLRQVADILTSQSRMNDSVTVALTSLALQADKYDAEIAALRRRCDILEGRHLHSVHVPQ